MQKTCRDCLIEQPIENFAVDKQQADKKRANCRACESIRRKAWYQANRESEIARTAEWQKRNPEKVKVNRQSTYYRNHESRKARNRAAYARDKDRICEQSRERYRHDAEFREKLLHRQIVDRSNPNVREKRNEYSRQWRKKNPDRLHHLSRSWAARNPERIKEIMRLAAHNRRVKQRGQAPISKEAWASVLDFYGHQCAYCFRTAEQTGRKLTIDHIRPVSRGGTNETDNLAPACLSCNSKKGKRNPLEFLAGIRPMIGGNPPFY